MRSAACRWMLGLGLALLGSGALARTASADFPAQDSAYHNYDEVTAETKAIADAYPSIVQRISIGQSFEHRDIWALKVSDNVTTDEDEPEVLIDANQHAREHLTVEMALYLLDELTSKYATDPRIKSIVDSREIWIVPTVNPDGAEYDIASGQYANWRKNRQPNAGSPEIGTDLNRNWGWQWGCCNGSSSSPANEEYRGASAFSAPETQALRDFVLSRRVGGVQQIKASIDFHSFGELVMWPYAYTFADIAPGMTQDQHDTFAAIGTSMAQSNGYTPQQASDLYISDGNLRDWLWGSQGIFAYGIEMYPPDPSNLGGFYPPDEIIAAQTARNREAVLRLIESADCPYRAIGKETQYCGIVTPPRHTFSPPAVDFGAVGIDDGPSPTRTIVMTNVSATSLHVSSATLGGGDTAQFAVRSNTCAGATLAASMTCAFAVEFNPDATGAKAAQVTFVDDSGTATVALTGTGTDAASDTTPPPPPGPPPPPPPPPASPGAGGPAAALTSKTASFDASGHVRLRIRCRATAPARCRGTITFKARLPGAKRATTIAKASYAIAAGTTTVKLRLRAAARRALRRRSAFTVSATVTTTTSGRRSASTSTRLKLVRRR
jgi:hypothetical protein